MPARTPSEHPDPTAGAPRDPGLAAERTALAWLRTGLAIVVAALFVGRLAVIGVGLGAVFPTLLAAGAGLWVVLTALRRRSVVGHEGPHLRDGLLPTVVTAALVLVCIVEILSAIVT